MGGCGSCVNSRGKQLEVQVLLTNSVRSGNLDDLRSAIQAAQSSGIDTLAARQAYAELARQERHAPESTEQMLKWAMSTQDGAILQHVIQEIQDATPSHPELPAAVACLQEIQDGAKQRLLRTSSVRARRASRRDSRRASRPRRDVTETAAETCATVYTSSDSDAAA